MPEPRLRVAFVAGTLGRGGAEKQLVYMVRALRECGADARVFSLTRGEPCEAALRDMKVPIEWVGRRHTPLARVLALVAALWRFTPHVVQSGHFYVNLYAALAARIYGAVCVGAVRGDVANDLASTGRWGRWLMRVPTVLLVNSHAAAAKLSAQGMPSVRALVVPNVIDIVDFDRVAASDPRVTDWAGRVVVLGVGSLIRAKRFDRFLGALARARRDAPDLLGVIVGDGPEHARLRMNAEALGLLPNGVSFLGRRHDVPALMRRSDALMLTSDHEGFPNVVLEAMCAGIPVLATPAGDVGAVVRQGETGWIVPPDDEAALAAQLVALAGDAARRSAWGLAGRRLVMSAYGFGLLAPRLLEVYKAVAQRPSALATAVDHAAASRAVDHLTWS